MKYTTEIIEEIRQGILGFQGRVMACKNAGIDYQTFLRWMNGELPKGIENKSEFCDLIKKTEAEVRIKGREAAINTIMYLITVKKSFYAAAWWLERNYPKEFSLNREGGEPVDLTAIAKKFEELNK